MTGKRMAVELGLQVEPIDGPVGARVDGIDASLPPTRAQVECLRHLVAEHCCLILHGQRLDEAQHVNFAGGFGATELPWLHAVEMDTFGRRDELPGRPGYTGALPGVVYFVNGPQYRDKPDDGYLQYWHADMTHVQVPMHFAFLYAVEAPEYGYETWYSSQYLGYESLDEETRAKVDGLYVTHSFQHVFPNLPPVVHPVVLEHPLTGRRAIYGIPGSADACPLGLSEDEGEEIMARITAHLERDDMIYKHRWTTGDLVIWDNRCALHRRGPQEKGQTRILRRVMAEDGHKYDLRRNLMGY